MNRTTVGGPELGGGRGAGGVVVLVDPSGAGQSPVAALLAEGLHPSVHLRADDFLRVIRRGQLPPHLPEADRQNTTALAAAAQAAFAYATGGYQVVVECSTAPPALDTFRRESRTTGAALHYVVLDPADPHTPETATRTILTALTEGTHLLGW
ncbi:ATP-binding protein [Kitasatospora aureofaciens]|uniref:ATP-binding protein n=1 Tax=Kitasatospora aureofaciens TaxID=1894 RepID=UPI001C45FFE3|nr:ATP-binding protein [Kitasatospora aureofaciens]MBV6698046.1 ATP-binding protein [Kitasatospora aureofaciens]